MRCNSLRRSLLLCNVSALTRLDLPGTELALGVEGPTRPVSHSPSEWLSNSDSVFILVALAFPRAALVLTGTGVML